MKFNERVIIATHYHIYCLNRAGDDPVGGYEDINQLFTELAKSDPKLKEMLNEEFNSVFYPDEYEQGTGTH